VRDFACAISPAQTLNPSTIDMTSPGFAINSARCHFAEQHNGQASQYVRMGRAHPVPRRRADPGLCLSLLRRPGSMRTEDFATRNPPAVRV